MHLKKTLFIMIACLIFEAMCLPKAIAIVPSPISLADDRSQPPEETVSESTSPPTTREMLDKLAADELWLKNILRDLKQAREALRRAESKETPNGHSIR